jgi:hypothetical protein
MASTSETGHAKNVANFKTLISFCTSYGSAYNPTKASLQITSLDLLLQQAEAELGKVQNTAATFNKATNERSSAFKGLKSFGTQVINALAVSGASNGTINNAKGINRKLQGQRAEAKPAELSPEGGQTTSEANKTISVSQQSYDQQVEHIAKMLELLKSDDNYKPNEEELKIVNISQKLDLLKAANAKVVNEYTSYSNSLLSRDNTLYNPLTGLVAVASDVKKYVLSVYKATSPQYKQVSGIPFRSVKR